VWAMALVFLLDNLGFQISAVLAGLGIGGIAVALASQAVLGDLFSYFSIMFDQPFEVGDAISVGDFGGTVEHVGIKTTRVRSVTGEQVVFSNTDLTSSRLRNFKRMGRRRVQFTLGVTYDTPSEKLEALPALLKKLVLESPEVDFDRAHFASYGNSSLNFEVAYFVRSPDYTLYMDVQQALYFRIKRSFEALGVEFAFPTQTVHLSKPVSK
jgi:small-conductance mechanosensitive channel